MRIAGKYIDGEPLGRRAFVGYYDKLYRNSGWADCQEVSLIELLMLAAATANNVPTAREAYVGCYLLIQGKDIPETPQADIEPYSAASCLLLVGVAAEREAAKPSGERIFCLPNIIARNPYRDMALAYVEFYENEAAATAKYSSIPVAAAGWAKKWPCPR